MKRETNVKSVKKRSARPFVLILALVMMLGSVSGGTIAWLISNTDPVVNTFTYGDINLKLNETEVDENGEPVLDDEGIPSKTEEGNDYQMIPGEEYLKDPAVTVLKGNEACWLFVKLEEKGGVTVTNPDGSPTTYDFDDYLTYEVAEGWTPLLDGEEVVEGIYFRYVGEDTDDIAVTYQILKDDKISVLDTVNKEMLNALDNNGQNPTSENYPSLAITAYAVQYSGFEPEVSDGATEPNAEQICAAALRAWRAVEDENTVTP